MGLCAEKTNWGSGHQMHFPLKENVGHEIAVKKLAQTEEQTGRLTDGQKGRQADRRPGRKAEGQVAEILFNTLSNGPKHARCCTKH